MAYAIDIQKRRIMKLNKTSLLSAGALIASLSFYAGTITTPAGAGVSYATTAQLNAQVSKLTNQINVLTQKQSATTRALTAGLTTWSAAQNRCSENSGYCGVGQMNLASDISDAFNQAGITP